MNINEGLSIIMQFSFSIPKYCLMMPVRLRLLLSCKSKINYLLGIHERNKKCKIF